MLQQVLAKVHSSPIHITACNAAIGNKSTPRAQRMIQLVLLQQASKAQVMPEPCQTLDCCDMLCKDTPAHCVSQLALLQQGPKARPLPNA